MPTPFFIAADQAPVPLTVVGEAITVLASGCQTGSFEVFRQAGPEGSGPPPHSHPWDEAFYVLDGDVAFGLEHQHLLAAPGTFVHVPADTMHWFGFGPGGGAMISITSREGASLMFRDFDREIDPANPDLAQLVELGRPYGLTVAAPPGQGAGPRAG